jgi:hypothetical protein
MQKNKAAEQAPLYISIQFPAISSVGWGDIPDGRERGHVMASAA